MHNCADAQFKKLFSNTNKMEVSFIFSIIKFRNESSQPWNEGIEGQKEKKKQKGMNSWKR